jgi:beta-glucosidase
VPLEPGGARRVEFRVHADRTAFTGLDLTRIVEPGDLELLAGSSSTDLPCRGTVRLTGPPRTVGHDRVLTTPVAVLPVPDNARQQNEQHASQA